MEQSKKETMDKHYDRIVKEENNSTNEKELWKA